MKTHFIGKKGVKNHIIGLKSVICSWIVGLNVYNRGNRDREGMAK